MFQLYYVLTYIEEINNTYSSPYLRPREIGYYLYAIREAVDSKNDVTAIHSMEAFLKLKETRTENAFLKLAPCIM